jgi:predicted Fe-Mo cluster-binding NifX family protein
VDILICGAISRPFITMLSGLGIDIIPWISGNWKDVLEAYLDGNLFRPDFLRPGFKKNKICRKN